MEPNFDGSMTIDRNRDIDVLGDNKAGSCVGFEQVRDLRTRNQNSGLLEDRRNTRYISGAEELSTGAGNLVRQLSI